MKHHLWFTGVTLILASPLFACGGTKVIRMGPELGPRSEPARIVYKEHMAHLDPLDYTLVGRVSKRTTWCGITPAKEDESNHRALAVAAARLGADVVVISCGEIGTVGQCDCTGDALLMKTSLEKAAARSTPPAADVPGCGKDTDCKGDRICDHGQCVEPHH